MDKSKKDFNLEQYCAQVAANLNYLSLPLISDWTRDSLKVLRLEHFQQAPLPVMDQINGFLHLERQYQVEKWYDDNAKGAKPLKFTPLPHICTELEALLDQL